MISDVEKMRIKIDTSLGNDTPIYRFISLEGFLSFVENRQTYVTRIATWEDKWEAILERVPTIDDTGTEIQAISVFYSDLFGQSWTLLSESDALWKIYSPNRTGIAISSTIEKFNLIQELNNCYVGKVIYFEGNRDLIEKAKLSQSEFHTACLKRAVFKHEKEVRLVTHINHLPVDYTFRDMYVYLKLDPIVFIDSITIDPRADDWLVDMVISYCKRTGFNIIPKKSSLYEQDPHLTIGVKKRWVIDDKKN